MNSVYLIYDQAGEFVNRIVAAEDFCKEYCADRQYTYERAEEQTEPDLPTELQVLGQQITDEQLERIAMGQEYTELELAILQGGISHV